MQCGPEQHAQQHPIKQKSDAASEESPESAGCGGRRRTHARGGMPRARLPHARQSCKSLAAAELAADHEQRRNIVLAASLIGGLHQFAGHLRGVALVALDAVPDRHRAEYVAQAIAAQQEGRLRLEMATADLDKTIIARLVRPRAHVPEYLVAPRVQHGLLFGELAGV